MIAFATVSDPSRIGVVLDLESGRQHDIPSRPEFDDGTVVGRPRCRPFGITWCADRLFVVNNRQLLTFDRGLRFAGIHSATLQINTHQISYHDDRIWAASPWTNSLIGISVDHGPDVEFDFMSQALKPYRLRDAPETDDVTHVNSLLWTTDNGLIVGVHNGDKPSFILRYDATSLRLDAMINDAGSATHCLAYDDQGLFWISTGSQEIRSERGFALPITRAGFARGLAATADHFVVAISERKERAGRATGDAWIQVLDRRDEGVVAEHHLVGTGSVNDLRLLDVYDYAHHVTPIWADAAADLDFAAEHAGSA